MKSNQKSMKWGVDLSTQLSKKGPNQRDEWLKKRRSCNTILDAHIKNLTPEKGQLVRLYTNMLFWSQNQVQRKRFPVSVCKKHGILLTSDLFEAKPCEHVAVPWHHPPNPPKPIQNLPPARGSWGFMVPALAFGHPNLLLKFESSPVYFCYFSICFNRFMDSKIQSNISVFVTNPWNLSESKCWFQLPTLTCGESQHARNFGALTSAWTNLLQTIWIFDASTGCSQPPSLSGVGRFTCQLTVCEPKWTVREHRHLPNDVRSVETSETYALGNTIR